MKQVSKLFIVGFVLFSKTFFGQNINSQLIGTYTDGNSYDTITSLTLKNDRTFELTTPDPVFPYTYVKYTTIGIWTAKGNEVTLNPNKQPRNTEVKISQAKHTNTDSISIKINYSLKEYENEKLISERLFDFDLLTIYINKRRKYFNLVRYNKASNCAFAPKVKHQVVVDSSNTIKISKVEIEKIGLYTYGFIKPVELYVLDPNADYFEVAIVQEIDKERMPRSKNVIIEGNKAFFYEHNGKVDKSLSILIKKEE